MSLQLIAKQMEAKGRKGDSMLVHMTPEEVAGLQKLAESAGGSLSVNPETGLVEANFLKRMLPMLAGAGLAMIPGVGPLMAAGIVGGGTALATGNVKKGLMAGLGAYGGAGLAGGLGAAAAAPTAGTAAGTASASGATNAAAANLTPSAIPAPAASFTRDMIVGTPPSAIAPEMTASMVPQPNLAAQYGLNSGTAAPTTFSANLSRAGDGIARLGDAQGRRAFGEEFGFRQAMAAAAPLMMDDRKQAEAPTDDEMYSYTYDVGRTGAERNPSATSAEREYFQSSYSPMRRIRARDYAAQGGLMSLAEGGETAAPTAAEVAAPSASEAALAYLMGERSSSAGLPAVRAPSTPASNIGVGGDNMYAFDPVTGTFLRNPNVAGAASSAVRGPVGTSFAGIGGGSDYTDPNPGWTNMSDAEKAAYYAENPTMGAVTRAGQTVFGYVAPVFAAAQDYMAPGYRENQALIAQGIDPMGPQYGGEYVAVMDPQNSDFVGPQESPGEGLSGNQNFGGGFDYSGSYDSYSSDSNSGGGGGYEGSGTGYGGDGSEFAQGGLMGLAKGGMASGGFVVPADVVSALGNGSTDAGLRKLHAMTGNIKPIKGKGDGLSDSIPTNIDGKQPARVADGEAYIDPKTVKRLGGAKKLYAMMDKVRAQAHGKTTQQRKVNPARVMA